MPVSTQIIPTTMPDTILQPAAFAFIFFQNIPATKAKNMGPVTQAMSTVTNSLRKDC